MNQLGRRVSRYALVLLACLGRLTTSAGEPPKLKAAFLYVGPIGDFGWSRAQDDARKEVERELPWIETSYIESVNEGEFEAYVDQMVQQGVKVIFAPSTSFTDASIAAAARHPEIMIFCGSGYKRSPNVATYRADAYQCFYLLGLMAGALTKSDKTGYVGGSPTPDAAREVNSFTLGLRQIRPNAVLDVRWINSYYDPPAAKEAAEALVSEGVDFLLSDTDSPTVVEVAGRHHIPVNGFTFDMHAAAPDYMISGALFKWTRPYSNLFRSIRDGTYTPHNLEDVDLWWRLSEGVAELAYTPGVPINPRFIPMLRAVQVDGGAGRRISAYDLVLERLAQMSLPSVTFEPFTGPIRDADGRLRIPAGHVATKKELYAMTWRTEGIQGPWPSE